MEINEPRVQPKRAPSPLLRIARDSALRFIAVLALALLMLWGIFAASGSEATESSSLTTTIARAFRGATVSIRLVGAAALFSFLLIVTLLAVEARYGRRTSTIRWLLNIASASPAVFIAYTLSGLFLGMDWEPGSFPDAFSRWSFALVAVAIGDGFFRDTMDLAEDHYQSVLRENYVRFARASGFPLARQIGPDLLARSLAILGAKIVPLMSATVIVESALGSATLLSGLGYSVTLSVQYGQRRDLLIALTLFVAIVAFANAVLRVATAKIDPRQRD